MALIRYLLITAVCLSAYVPVPAQTIYYPAGASELLKSTAEDVAMLMQQAVAGSHFTVQPYTNLPNNGIIFVYDDAVAANQTCKVNSDGINTIQFSAPQDNGLNFGVYQYLQQLGFRFYQPGTIWEIIPALSSPYKRMDTLYNCKFKYKNWFISGGHNTWAMDKNSSYSWDTYFGDIGHQWALYQRRNNMVGGNRFIGHRGDIFTNSYLTALQNNPCYVAPYNGSRQAGNQSVPDINNIAAMQLWGTAIEQKYTQFKNTIFGNPGIYANFFHNFNYNNDYIGIEVPDGAHWANSIDNSGCGNKDYVKESDQQFILANYTAAAINAIYPGKRFQLYAYDGHADVPSAKITINDNIDVQVVPTAFQSETSAKGLLNRWYNRTKNIAEYHYLNLPQWSGETPSFFLDELKTTIQRAKEKQSQGIVWEASPAKFASLPFLLAANASLKDDKDIDAVLHEFCNMLFGNASATIYQLLQYWSSDKTVTVSNGIQDNKYKLPLYFQLLNQAVQETQNAPAIVKERINELKVYLHYMVLYFDWASDQRSNAAKADKAAALCFYLAKISKLQVVNSYFLISDIVSRYSTTDNMNIKYNASSGTVYQNGALPLITAEEINTNFINDFAAQAMLITKYDCKEADQIKNLFETNNLSPLEKINVKVNYTNGKDYGTRSEFYIIANAAGSFTLKYTPRFDIPEKGYINFTVEATGNTLGIIKDFTINNNSGPGVIYVPLPSAGTYKLSIVSKYKSATDLLITTNGNYFYKNGPYLGNTIENYSGDLLSLPGYFYVPSGMNKIYFSLNNSNPGGAGFATPVEVNKAFEFKDNENKTIVAKLATTADSALFYLDVPSGSDGSFWQAFKMEQYRLCFANTSNIQWYAQRRPCATINFIAEIKEGSASCITILKAIGSSTSLHWKVYDAQKWYYYDNVKEVELPGNISPNAIVTITGYNNCFTTKRIGDDLQYLKQKTACATGAPLVADVVKTMLYPNPGTGMFRCRKNGEPVLAEDITIYNTSGLKVANFNNIQEFNISHLPEAIYFYTILINKVSFKGRLVKL